VHRYVYAGPDVDGRSYSVASVEMLAQCYGLGLEDLAVLRHFDSVETAEGQQAQQHLPCG
jgi:hypothetical protein